MESYAQQLHLGLPNRNVNIKSPYVRGMNKYQVQLGTEDWSLDFYNDTQALENMSNMDGWNEDSDRDLTEEVFHDENYSNLFGTRSVFGYPAIVSGQRKECKQTCKDDKGLKWGQGGKQCYSSCVNQIKLDKKGLSSDVLIGGGSDSGAGAGAGSGAGAGASEGSGSKTGLVVGIVAGVAVLGVVTVLLLRKK